MVYTYNPDGTLRVSQSICPLLADSFRISTIVPEAFLIIITPTFLSSINEYSKEAHSLAGLGFTLMFNPKYGPNRLGSIAALAL